jgi:hypothetical protein
MLLPKQTSEENIRTGRLPKHVWMGTLSDFSIVLNIEREFVPYEVAKPKHQDCDTGELNDVG